MTLDVFGTRTASFSDDRRHRYTLTRIVRVATEPRATLFIGLNPSTADETNDDNTIKKEMAFTRRWGFDRLLKGNLFSYKSTDPAGMVDVADAHGGADNMYAILTMAEQAQLIVCAWGGPYAPKRLQNRIEAQVRVVTDALMLAGEQLHCLALTKDGFPRHPLYLRGDIEPQLWRSCVER